MTTTHAGALLRHLHTFVAAENSGGPTDRQLLEQFAARREAAAFEALVRRHAPLVLSVCRRVLRHEQDAEDAFQATFLVLARKAREVGRQGSVAGWLHRVAYHAAIRARARAAARRERERQAPPRQPADLLAEVTGRELLEVLDEELQHLSDGCRAPLVLCYLQGRTCDDAARQLGWSVRTLKRRLEQGRNCLRARLARRGIALPAALLALGLTRGARAGVSAKLTALTVRAAVGGAAASPAGALAEAVLRGMTATRLKVLGAVLLLGAILFGTGVAAHQAPAQRPDPAPPAAGAPAPPAPAAVKDEPGAKKSAVTGRVLDADGKPVAGARVAPYASLDLGRLSVEARIRRLDDVTTDDEGRFRIPLPDEVSQRLDRVELLAGAKGYGPAWSRGLPRGREVELRLPPEDAATGQLIDLTGRPVAGAKLRPVLVLPGRAPKPPAGEKPAGAEMKQLAEVQRAQQGFHFSPYSPLKDSPLWPAPVTSDAQGNFRLTGFGKGQEVRLLVESEDVAAQEVVVEVGAKGRSFSLVPPHKVSGRAVLADTEKPLAGASVSVTSYHERVPHAVNARTDADGRFAVNAYPGETFSVAVFPPADEPYLATSRSLDWPKGAVKQEVNLKLPRGVVVRGKVVEAGTGKAIDSAAVVYVAQRENNPDFPRAELATLGWKHFTHPDGTFRMVVPPGSGHLLVTGPNPDYVYRTVTEGELRAGQRDGQVERSHALMPITLGAKDAPKQVAFELRRSVAIKGRVVGPDGKPVKDAIVFVPSELLPPPQEGASFAAFQFGLPFGLRVSAVAVHDGTFELPHCDPDKTYRVFVMSGSAQWEGMMRMAGPLPFLDASSVVNRLIAARDALGAVADISARGAGGKPVEIKLAPCESAEVRVVGADGKAVKQKLWLELLVTPGPSVPKSREQGKPAAETALLATPYSLRGEKSPVAPDADGKISIPGLIPGATYRLTAKAGPEGMENEILFEKDFTVEAGKKTKLELVAPEGK